MDRNYILLFSFSQGNMTAVTILCSVCILFLFFSSTETRDVAMLLFDAIEKTFKKNMRRRFFHELLVLIRW
jgi:hypothetical protein